MVRTVRAVVFDFDGTIVDTETAVFEGYRKVFERHGARFEFADFARNVGTRDAVNWPELLAERTGQPLRDPRSLYEEVRMEVLDLLAEPVTRPGIRNWIDEARGLGLVAAIASSSERTWIDPLLDALDLADAFVHVSSWEGPHVGRPKPAPDLYVSACEALAVAPHQALAVEDSANGVTAAKQAGLLCVAVPFGFVEHFDFSGADLVLDSHSDATLTDVLERLGVEPWAG